MDDREQKIQKLKEYFANRDDVVMAFLFGSRAEAQARTISDWDIAVYFLPSDSRIEWEETGREYPHEGEIWADLTRLLETDNRFSTLSTIRACSSSSISETRNFSTDLSRHCLDQ